MDFEYLIQLNAPEGFTKVDLVYRWAETKQKLFGLLEKANDRAQEGEKLERHFSEDVLKLYREYAKLEETDDDFLGIFNLNNFSLF